MSSINWADLVKDAGESSSGNYEPLPNGDYDLKVIEVKATVTASGKTMFKLTTEVQGGAYSKRRIWDNLVISPENKNALAIFFGKMAALGLPREFFNNNPSNAQIEASLDGKSFRAQVGSREWQGSKRNELTKYYVQASQVATPVATTAGAAVPPPPPAPAPAPAGVPLSAPADAPF
jgi:hypothetical protein